MPMRLLPLIFLFPAVLCSFALEDADYLPINEGAEWVMEATITAPDGKVTKSTARRTIGMPEEHDGKAYLRSVVVMDGPQPFSYTRFVRKDATGVYSYDP